MQRRPDSEWRRYPPHQRRRGAIHARSRPARPCQAMRAACFAPSAAMEPVSRSQARENRARRRTAAARSVAAESVRAEPTGFNHQSRVRSRTPKCQTLVRATGLSARNFSGVPGHGLRCYAELKECESCPSLSGPFSSQRLATAPPASASHSRALPWLSAARSALRQIAARRPWLRCPRSRLPLKSRPRAARRRIDRSRPGFRP